MSREILVNNFLKKDTTKKILVDIADQRKSMNEYLKKSNVHGLLGCQLIFFVGVAIVSFWISKVLGLMMGCLLWWVYEASKGSAFPHKGRVPGVDKLLSEFMTYAYPGSIISQKKGYLDANTLVDIKDVLKMDRVDQVAGYTMSGEDGVVLSGSYCELCMYDEQEKVATDECLYYATSVVYGSHTDFYANKRLVIKAHMTNIGSFGHRIQFEDKRFSDRRVVDCEDEVVARKILTSEVIEKMGLSTSTWAGSVFIIRSNTITLLQPQHGTSMDHLAISSRECVNSRAKRACMSYIRKVDVYKSVVAFFG